MVKIYTRTGDRGQTSLFGGKRISKASLQVEAYGTVDELNSAIGVAITEVLSIKYQVSSIKKELIKIQHDLFTIGSILASSSTKRYTLDPRRLKNRVTDFERLIDQLTEKLPQLRNFILPGGGKAGAALHLARAVSRRAERRVVALSKRQPVISDILVYLNRLSDLLFTMARFANYQQKQKEIIWEKNK